MKIRPGHKKGSLAVELNPNDTRLFEGTASTSEPEAFGIKIRKILVPIDFSDCSKRALRSAIAFAKQYRAEITLLSVVPDERTVFEYGEPEFLSLEKSRQERYERELRKLIDTTKAGVPLHFLVRTGRPFSEIVGAARTLNADVIVISTHGQEGTSSSILGSTTEKVIRHAPCPVIVVREKGRDLVSASPVESDKPETIPC
jgi:nucleotide-binding universal stress UspA family protein